MINIILFGPPGSGKGTQADFIAKKYNLAHISTGDLFRYEMTHNTELGKEAKSYMDQGLLVPDSVTIEMLKKKVMENLKTSNGFIFDGYPRTIPQAVELDSMLNSLDQRVSVLIALEVEEDEIVARILKRGKSSGRSDDNDESIIRNRIKVYKKDTTPVYDYYNESNKSYTVLGTGSLEEITVRLSSIIDNFTK